MMARWMFAAALLGLALTLGGMCTVRLWPRLGWSRRWLWLALMAVTVCLPVLLALRPPAVIPDTASPSSSVSQPLVGPTEAAAAPSLDTILLAAWGVTSLALAFFFAMTQRRIIGQVALWQHRELLGHTVAVSADFGPAAVGLLRASVVLPEWVFELPADEQRMVLAHEREHIAAGDHFVLLAGVVMIVLMPWNPGLWWQLRRLRVGMELDCDARVAPLATDRPRYGQLLLQARARQRSYQGALAFVPTPSVLAERLNALLESARMSRRRMMAWGVSALACAASVTRIPVPSLKPWLEPRVTAIEAKAAPPVTPDIRAGTSSYGELRALPPAASTRRMHRRAAASANTAESTRNASAPLAAPPPTVVGVNPPQDGFGGARSTIGGAAGRVVGGRGGGGGGGGGGRSGGGFSSVAPTPGGRAVFRPDSGSNAVIPAALGGRGGQARITRIQLPDSIPGQRD